MRTKAESHTDIKLPAPQPSVPRCEQCGEELAPERHRKRPIRRLCVDCAYDTLPCTD